MRDFLRRSAGEEKPKQYCRLAGSRTMLEDAQERAMHAGGAERLVTVLGEGHSRHVEAAGIAPLPGRTLEEPISRGTGPGVLLPLASILSEDPEATVAVFPSDGYVSPEELFQARLEQAFRCAEQRPERLVLLAATASHPETDYGWVEPGPRDGPSEEGGARLVASFKEKPGPAEAERLFRAGALWNSMMLVAKAPALWETARSAQPQLWARFEALRRTVGTIYEKATADWAFRGLRPCDLSKDIVESSIDRLLVIELEGIDWSDLGRPERVAAALEKKGVASASRPAGGWL